MKRLALFLLVMALGLSLVSLAQAQTLITTTVTSSSNYSSTYTAPKTIDKSLSTYWRGARNTSPWWLRYDLQGEYRLDKITIWWHNSYPATNYEIQLSTDGTNWATVLSGLNSSGGSTNPKELSHNLGAVNARYLRIYIRAVKLYYPTIYEVKIYGLANQAPTAFIDSITPNPAQQTEAVSFTGHGTDADGSISAYNWRSSINGNLSTTSSFTTSGLSVGTHTIYFKVQDNAGAWSNEITRILTVTAETVQIPALLRFQARLEDAQGLPLGGSFDLTFKLYDTATGGTALWEEKQQDVEVEDGLVDVELGSVNKTLGNLAFNKQYWLGVAVESDSEMTPRFKLTTVPYSFRSEK